MSLKKLLALFIAADVVLGAIAYFVVFYSTPGTYDIANSPLPTTGTLPATSTIALATSTASSTQASTSSAAGLGTPSTSTVTGNPSNAVYATDYAIPYPITWSETDASISVMGASLQGNQFTLKLAVAMGNVLQCVPLNIRLLADEKGDFAAPITQQFTFPETNSCEGAPGATYTDQQIVFDTDSIPFPAFFTTGGVSNIFFQVATTSAGGLNVTIPQASGQ